MPGNNVAKSGAVAVGGIGIFVLLKKALPFLVAFGATRAVAGRFSNPEEERLFRSGFEQVSRGFDDWEEIWQDTTALQWTQWGARVAAFYVTEDEILEVYQMRVDFYESSSMSPNSARSCDPEAVLSNAEDLPDAEPISIQVHEILGRGFARVHEGREPWQPTVDSETSDEVLFAFGEYLDSQGLNLVRDWLTGDYVPTGTGLCEVTASLYSIAVQRFQDRIGPIRLIDFVRSLDVMGLGELGI